MPDDNNTQQPNQNAQQNASSTSSSSSNSPKPPTLTAGKIAIGFGLEGYQTKQNDSTEGGGIPSSSAIAAWNDVETVEDRYVKDDSLKQILVQVTCFQSAPLRWNHPTDGTTYIDCMDNADTQSWSDSPIAAWGRVHGCTNDPKLEKVKLAQKKLNGADYDSGYAICWKTLSDYLNHFYNLNVSRDQIYGKGGKNGLLPDGLVKAELFINMGGGEGKAIRLYPSSNAGDRGYKGSICSGGTTAGTTHTAKYDKFDINISATLCKTFEGVVKPYSSKHNCAINEGTLDFPWKDVEYDWKTGKIPGYNPNELIKWTNNKFGKANNVHADVAIKFTSKQLTDEFRVISGKNINVSKPLARVRFFTDNLEAARQYVPGLPDEFAKTNYAEGATAVFAEDVTVDDPLLQYFINKPVVISPVNYRLKNIPSK